MVGAGDSVTAAATVAPSAVVLAAEIRGASKVAVFTIEDGRIAAIDLVMEPEHLAALDVRID
jgi:hypothetical protein